MRVPLIGTISADTPETAPFPEIDANARISYNEKDGESYDVFNIDNVVCMDNRTPDGKNGKCFELESLALGKWTVACTNNRITFWSPLTAALFGNKGKEKPGKCSAGHLSYLQIGMLVTGYIDANTPFLAVTCNRVDGTYSSILMFSKDMGILRTLAMTIHSRLSEHVQKGKFTDSDGNIVAADEKYINEWKLFEEKMWSDSDSDIKFVVPTPATAATPNSRISAT